MNKKINFQESINIIINSKNVKELKQNLIENGFQLKDLKNINKDNLKGYNVQGFDILIHFIENNATQEVVQYIIINGKYTNLNYVNIYNINNKNYIKTPLSSALEINNLSLSNFLIENGATLEYIPLNLLVQSINNENYKFIFQSHQIHIKKKLLKAIIKNGNKNYALKEIFNDKPESKQLINRSIYKTAIKSKNYEALTILYNNDSRERKYIFNDFSEIFKPPPPFDNEMLNETNEYYPNEKDKLELIERLKNSELEFSVNNIFINSLNNQENLIKLIQNNKLNDFEDYVNKNPVILTEFRYMENTGIDKDILSYAIEHHVSLDFLKFLIQKCLEEKPDFIEYNRNYEDMFYTAISRNNFNAADYILDQYKDSGKTYNYMFSNLYCSFDPHLLNDKNLEYFIETPIPHDCSTNEFLSIDSLVENNELEILRKIFKYYENEKNITNESDKISINFSLYKEAIYHDHLEMVNFLSEHDDRKKEDILDTIFQIVDGMNRAQKQKFLYNIKNGKITLPSVDYLDHFLNNLNENQNIWKAIVKKIENNSISELDDYLQEKNISLSCFHKDILIYAIENNSSFEMIRYLLSHYPSLNFISDRRTPLTCAISHNHFDIAELLIKHGADIHYNYDSEPFGYIFENVICYTIDKNLLNKKNLKFILNYEIEFIPKIISLLISSHEESHRKILNELLNNYVMDNHFIIKLLSYYHNATPLSNFQLQEMTLKEKQKISKNWYTYAFYDNGNRENIELLLRYDSNESELMSDTNNKEGNSDDGLIINNYIDFKNMNNDFEDILLLLLREKCPFDLLISFIQDSFKNDTLDLTKVNFEIILRELTDAVNSSASSHSEIIKIFIYEYFHHKDFNIKYINIEKSVAILCPLEDNISNLNYFIHILIQCHQFSIKDSMNDISLLLKELDCLDLVNNI
ncbi:hypothetical protein LY90DRAFT_647355 [Neocallimastix californiae]|uniref:Uncharacterized protein n=1 Tax=Neocallimastix californiae TaxID=1754190 RepID=A0A1Y2D4X4_9FUNG|nr:hypothetical protein LY90DRAFT_647355 [Neocallimastix californiae]|eukprot:ORY54348.1 hypothetical protein LY90DRAFT_647355 [Neocallimastix californiae]